MITILNTSIKATDNFELPIYVSRPVLGEKLPLIVFIHEVFGLNDEMKRLANSFAQEGFVVVMPNLMARSNWFSCVKKLMNDIKNEKGQSFDDINSVKNYASNLTMVDENKVVIMGLCMGGGFALILSKTGLYQIAAPFYGEVPQNLNGACPIVGSYGADDKITIEHAKKLQEETRKLNIPNDIKIYPNTGHSFMNKAPNKFLDVLGSVLPSHSAHNENAEIDARNRIVKFIREHL